ncbi:DUF4013 domain-containing protein [Methanobacterium sp.]|uniref:DUF4013 domain-containing protein n=1 Tax=Methanobacterium sp. TaxID=2164 RepID=UPI002ABC8CC3|nr:DUF4013 domain-containing protein [Methanobacterium sp.]MDY9923763.1 DUF4013 domain-containing protein [Methanobacterium sp.]
MTKSIEMVCVVPDRKLKTILKDAARYAVSDWYNLLILGLILLLTDHLIDLDAPSLIGGLSDVILIIIILFLSFMELGYGFRIVEETVEGSTSPPGFHHPLNLFVHGLKESLILIVYFILPLILMIIALSELDTLNIDLGPIINEYALLLVIIFFFCFNIILQGAILTMANHGGSIRWGFNMPRVFGKIRRVGLKNMFMVSLITIVVLYIIRQLIFDALHGIPYLGSTVGEIIGTVLIAPFLMIFTTRVLGLIDVPDNK